MVRINFGLHFSQSFENESELFEQMEDFIQEQYEDIQDLENLPSSEKMTTKEMFDELGWSIEQDEN